MSDNPITFKAGKYKGQDVRDVRKTDPKYLLNVYPRLHFFYCEYNAYCYVDDNIEEIKAEAVRMESEKKEGLFLLEQP